MSWTARLTLLHDLPIRERGRDLLELDTLVTVAANSLRVREFGPSGPMVIHVDGPWGSGKTSFCRLLEGRIREGTFPSRTAWYEASDDSGPASEALLFAVAQAIADGDPEETRRIVQTWGKRGRDTVLSTPTRLDDFRAWVERELGQRTPPARTDNETVAIPLDSDAPPDADTRAAPRVWTVPVKQPERRNIVIFIDDLDRCQPERVVEVLQAMRTFVSIAGINFVIAADRHVLDLAFTQSVEALGIESRRNASQAMEKYIRQRIVLPKLAGLSDMAMDGDRRAAVGATEFINRLIALQHRMLGTTGNLAFLAAPSALFADGVGVTLALTFRGALSPRRLKRILNAFAVDMARAVDRLQEPIDWSDEGVFDTEREGGPWHIARPDEFAPRWDDAPLRGVDDYAQFFAGRLIRTTARFMWPELFGDLDPRDPEFVRRAGRLVAIGRGLRLWPDELCTELLSTLGDTVEAATPLATRRDLCQLVGHLYGAIAPLAEVAEALGSADLSNLPPEFDATPDAAPAKPQFVQEPITGQQKYSKRAVSIFDSPASASGAAPPAAVKPEAKPALAARRGPVHASSPAPTQASKPSAPRTLPTPEQPAEAEQRGADEQIDDALEFAVSDGLETSAGEEAMEEGPETEAIGSDDHAIEPRDADAHEALLDVSKKLNLAAGATTPEIFADHLGDAAHMLTLILEAHELTLEQKRYMRTVSDTLTELVATKRRDLSGAYDHLLELAEAMKQFSFDWSEKLLELLVEESPSNGSLAPYLEVLLALGSHDKAAAVVQSYIAYVDSSPKSVRFWLALAELVRRRDELAPTYSKRLNGVYTTFVRFWRSDRTVESALNAVRLRDALALSNEDILNEIRASFRFLEPDVDPPTTPTERELTLAVADSLLGTTDPSHPAVAHALYRKLEHSELRSPELLHNMATIEFSGDPDDSYGKAGAHWLAAYRMDRSNSRLNRGFSRYLQHHGYERQALRVVRGTALPRDWNPFDPDPDGADESEQPG